MPILSYGHPILKQRCVEVPQTYPGLDDLIDAMWETMYNANGCGLAAPQVGRAIRLFVVNSKSTYEHMGASDRRHYFNPGDTGIVKTFINASIVERSETTWQDDEGCLSIPGLQQAVTRPWSVTVEYYDRNFQKYQETFSGATARMVQHEFDHTEGILFLNYLKPLTRRLLEGKLKKIAKGQVAVRYPMVFCK